MAPTVYNKSETVTPSDATDLTGGLTLALYIGGAGTVTVVYQDGRTQQFTATAGLTLPVSIKRVNATGTAATNMVALYSV